MLSQKQIEERVNDIGGSDAAAVLGVSHWSTPLKIWAEKTGELPHEDISDRLPVRLGHALEDTVAQLFSEETGKKVYRVNSTLFHPQYPFIAVNLDRRIVGEKAFLEAKTTSAWKRKDWEGDEIPQEYIVQCLHGLAVTGMERAYLAVLIGNEGFKIKTIERDEKLLNEVINREVRFWNDFVVPKVMPKSISKNDSETIQRLFPEAIQGKEVYLGDDAKQIIELLEGMKQDSKHLDGLIQQKENELKALIKENEIGVVGDKRVMWTNRKSRRLDMSLIKEEIPDIYLKYAKEVNSRFLQIKTIGGF